MGGGSYDATAYSAARTRRAATGASAFTHTAAIRSGASTSAVHESLDPAGLNTLGEKIRECLDSDDHPNATPVAVLFDETGSMADIPEKLVDRLEGLYGLLLRKGYCEDPQIMFGAIGDGYQGYEVAPLQVGQFESDNRAIDVLGNIYLERNGGGGGTESYDLALYFLGEHVRLDRVTKGRGKGYCFIVGDESVRPHLTRKEIKQYVGDDVEADIPFAQLLSKAQEMWEIFFIFPREASYFSRSPYVNEWRDRLGQNVLVVDNVDDICEVIGSTIGLMEGAVDDLDDVVNDLEEIGAGSASGTVSSALAHLTPKGAVTTSASPAGLDGAGATRL